LKVWWQDYSLVSCFSRELDTQIPGVKGDESEFEVLGNEVFVDKGVQTSDGVAE